MSFLEEILDLQKQIPENRRNILQSLASRIHAANLPAEKSINFICTHNSRRSQIAELMFRFALLHYGVENWRTYSGGTTATDFNYRVINALKRAGFIFTSSGGENPVYRINYPDLLLPQQDMFSKTYDDPFNPNKDFVAILVCSDADSNCPIVMGATCRFYLPYTDPKQFDDSREERAGYDEKIREIAAEMFFLLNEIKQMQ